MSELENLKNHLTKYGQQHLMQFWDKLSDNEKRNLQEEIEEINVEEVMSYFKRAVQSLEEGQQKLDDLMKPIPQEACGSVQRSSPEEVAAYEEEGLRLISEGKVGVLVLAGGQGTRLGVPYPKGMYDVGLPSHKSLFQIQAERIRQVEELAFARHGQRGNITWYIMTSEQTMEPTLEFLRSHSYFGLDSRNVKLFEQCMLPCFSLDGHIILDSPSHIARAPDGNGGLYRAMRDRGILEDIARRGVTCLHAHSVDNILVRVADPVFMGYCHLKGAECGAKVVCKAYPEEPLGVVASVDGKYRVVEYSEITDSTAQMRNEDGQLTFSAGSICNHYFTAEFIERIANKHERCLQLHVARKKVPYVDENGVQCNPQKPNGIKIEKFIFDVFEFTDKLVVWEVPREEEFSAVKNVSAVGKDCPATARVDVFRLHTIYVENAGGKVLPCEDGTRICEVSPLLSYRGESLEAHVAGRTFTSPLYLHAPCENARPITNGMSNGSTNGKTNGTTNGTTNGITNGTH